MPIPKLLIRQIPGGHQLREEFMYTFAVNLVVHSHSSIRKCSASMPRWDHRGFSGIGSRGPRRGLEASCVEVAFLLIRHSIPERTSTSGGTRPRFNPIASSYPGIRRQSVPMLHIVGPLRLLGNREPGVGFEDRPSFDARSQALISSQHHRVPPSGCRASMRAHLHS